MKLTVENLGVIRSAELDIRPFTVFIGPNNTNKTWVAHALYTLLRYQAWNLDISDPSGWNDTPAAVLEDDLAAALDALATSVAQRVAEPRGEASLSVAIKRSDFFPAHGDLVLTLGAQGLALALGAPKEALAGGTVRLRLRREELDAFGPPSILVTASRKEQFVGVALRSAEGSVTEGPGIMSLGDMSDEDITKDVRRFVRHYSLKALRNVLALPAERKLIAAIARSRRDADRMLARMSLPIIHFADFIDLPSGAGSSAPGERLAPQITDRVERLLGGRVTVPDTGDPLVFRFGSGRELPIQAAASLARSLAGLDLYLRSYARKGDVLIIDEPEMNAHPDVQVALTELLALLVNQGVQIVITTHSPYVVDHLTNLMEAWALPRAAQEPMAERFWLKTEEAFLDPERVGVYWFKESGEVADALDRVERSIDWDTLGKVSERVSNLYGDLLAAQREAAE
ncbi:AAA family ATPase [Sorangium sp. So ce281]|uniref:AAA family ATPase n=1 Tax=unclassified Sorangium TaxID=2621164 RepID=UPI003F63EDDF